MELKKETMISIIGWYQKNKRSLPWRDTGDPYDVLLSEVMLQQTRIEAVREKFIRFKKEIPDISSLANADDDRLMKLWEGLGYYSRARNLKKCAIAVRDRFKGIIPRSQSDLITLPGIGPYTSGAIAAIAFGSPAAAVDGNVMRVLSRLFLDRSDTRLTETRKAYEDCITKSYEQSRFSSEEVSSFTEGIMELGETVCLPNGMPKCNLCPLADDCLTRKEGLFDEIPFRSSLKERKITEKTLFILHDDSHFLLARRPEKGLLAGLYEFPAVERRIQEDELPSILHEMGYEIRIAEQLPSYRHVFTHLEWHMSVYDITIREATEKEGMIAVSRDELSLLAIPSAFKPVMDHIFSRSQ